MFTKFHPRVFARLILTGLVWLAVLSGLSPSARAQLTYGVTNGMFSVMGYNIAGGQNVIIPATNSGFAVRNIASFAFQSLPITNVVFPNTLTNIDPYAFYFCRQLRDVTLPASLKSVGLGPFGICWSMTNIFVDAGNTNFSSIGGVLFDKSGSNIVEFPAGRAGPYSAPEGTLSIGKAAFGGCLLSSFTFPSTLTNLEHYAFDSCAQLTNFTTHSANPALKAIDGVLYNKMLDTLVCYPGGLTNSFVIPTFLNITHIGNYAFMDTQVPGVVLPATLRDIGTLAFDGCQGLTSVIIPASVTNIQPAAFGECFNLTRIYFQGDRPTCIDPLYPIYPYSFADMFDSGLNYGLPKTFFYMTGKAGWSDSPVYVLWNPQFGPYAFTNQTLQFACTIPSNSIVVVENCTNLARNVWQPLATNTYVYGGPLTFTNIDDQITNKPVSLYRFRSP